MLKKLFARIDRTPAQRDRTRLAFKDNESAFRYACEFCDCTLKPESQVVALVLDVTGLPDEPPDFYIIKVASEDGGFDILAEPADSSDVFTAGELVSFWYSGSCDVKGAPKGLIGSRLLPELDTELGWKKA